MSTTCEKEEVKPARKGPAVKGVWHKYSMQSHVFSSLAAMPRAAKVQVGLCPATMGVNGGAGENTATACTSIHLEVSSNSHAKGGRDGG